MLKPGAFKVEYSMDLRLLSTRFSVLSKFSRRIHVSTNTYNQSRVKQSSDEINENRGNRKSISNETIAKLERLSLVDFGNAGGIERLERAINFAEQLRSFPVDNSVEPLYSVLENKKLRLRQDRVDQGNCRDKVLKNSAKIEDEYFVAPPGNIPKKQ